MDLLKANIRDNTSSVARSHHSLKINPQYLSYRVCQDKNVCSHAFKIGSYGREDGNFDTPSHVTSVRRFPSIRLHTTHIHNHNHSQIGNQCIVVSDSGNNRIQLFDLEGRWICSIDSVQNDSETKERKNNDIVTNEMGFTIPGAILAARMFALDWTTGLELPQNPQRFGLFVTENLATGDARSKWTFYDIDIDSLTKAVESPFTSTRRVRGQEIFTYQNWLSFDRNANRRFGACVRNITHSHSLSFFCVT